MMDLRSDPSEIGVGNFRISLNMACRESGKLCRSGGWVKLFADAENGFNNQDLHDQLITLQDYRESLEHVFSQPSEIVDYTSPYFTGAGYGEDGFGYGYGVPVPIFTPGGSYIYETCGDYFTRPGCREAVTMLVKIGSDSGSRRLLAGTRSRLYELSESSGNWRLIADGLGGTYTNSSEDNCDPCSNVRLQQAQLLGYTVFTNDFDAPFAYQFGAGIDGCNMRAAHQIEDLVALGITRAGCVCEYKGFILFADLTQDGHNYPGRVVWSDFNAPISFLPLPGISLANFADIAFNERILKMEQLGDYLMVYTDEAIHRGSLVLRQESGGIISEVFNFTELYKGPDSLKYRHTLVNTGASHIYASKDSLQLMMPNDRRPQLIEWIHKAGGAIYNGVNEFSTELQSLNEDISEALNFGKLNESRCHQFVGGYDDLNKEVWYSWPTDNNNCPNVSLRLNLKYSSPGIVNHGFTSFCSFSPDQRPSIREWLISIGACTPDDFQLVKEGPSGIDPEPPAVIPLYIWNETEDPSLPSHPLSICAALGNQSLGDICHSCSVGPIFIAASAEDLCLKELRDDIYVRERFAGFSYVDDPYPSFIQSGAEDFGTEVEKTINLITLEYRAVLQTTPSLVYSAVGFGSQASCPTWRDIGSRQLKCLTNKSRAEHEAARTRPSLDAKFPTYYRGKFLNYRYWTLGFGGGACYSKVELDVRNAQTRA